MHEWNNNSEIQYLFVDHMVPLLVTPGHDSDLSFPDPLSVLWPNVTNPHQHVKIIFKKHISPEVKLTLKSCAAWLMLKLWPPPPPQIILWLYIHICPVSWEVFLPTFQTSHHWLDCLSWGAEREASWRQRPVPSSPLEGGRSHNEAEAPSIYLFIYLSIFPGQ